MNISQIKAGNDVPNEINVIIEIPAGANPVKYELDKDSGALFVDRMLNTSMVYPYNYGFIPNTLSLDGDPADVLVISSMPVVHGCVIKCRPIGVLLMEDEAGKDEKIICLPTTKIDSYFADINEIDQLPQIVKDRINHFFEHYKDLEKGKFVKISGWKNSSVAKQLINESIDNFNK